MKKSNPTDKALSGYIPEDMHSRFKSTCARKKLLMQNELAECVRLYLERYEQALSQTIELHDDPATVETVIAELERTL